jgi:hypothetical protein
MSNKQNDIIDEDMKESADAALDEAQITADDSEKHDLPEAPASVTVKAWIKGYGVMITARDITVNGVLQKTGTIIDYAESHGWKNVWDTTPKATVGQPATPQTVPDVSTKHQPTCPVHGLTTVWKEGVSKKTGKPYGFWGGTEKHGDEWCKAKLTL